MSLESAVFKGVSWLALFKAASQAFSWSITILVARILDPSDYGLMSMATILTGYIAMFSELGLGAAIIQRPNLTRRELSSIFWFSLAFSILLGLGCFVLAYPTAAIFKEPRVIPLTRAVSLLFLITGLEIVPYSLLKRDLSFKHIGLIEMATTALSSVCMLIIASLGGGVWTLISGTLIHSGARAIVLYFRTGWVPDLYCSFQEVKTYLKFGINVALGRSLYYVHHRCDRFFAGRTWPASVLGLYTLALEISSLPTEKIVTLITQVTYPAFARLQNDKQALKRFYLRIVKTISILVFPLFVGISLVSAELVTVFLDEKWAPIIPLLRFLSLVQIFTALNSVNGFVHISQGRPGWTTINNAILAVVLPVSFFFAVQFGLQAILIPWFTSYLLIAIVWAVMTVRSLQIKVSEYVRVLLNPALTVIVMAGMILLWEASMHPLRLDLPPLWKLVTKIMLGAIVYGSLSWIQNRRLVARLVSSGQLAFWRDSHPVSPSTTETVAVSPER